MRKAGAVFIVVLLLLVGALSTTAWTGCTPAACSAGYTDSGIYCKGGTCYKNCTALICNNATGVQVFSVEFGVNQANKDELTASSSSYTPLNTSRCYNFTYAGPPTGSNTIFMAVNQNPSPDCDSESVGGMLQGATPWFSGITGYIGDQVNDNVDFMTSSVRAHSDTGSDDAGYEEQATLRSTIFCAPNMAACKPYAGTSGCDTDCYNVATQGKIVQGYYKKKSSANATLYAGDRCGNAYVSWNRQNPATFIVYETNTTVENNDKTCDRTNEAPSVTNIKVLPEFPTAGQDLLCNYTYVDPENYTEQASAFEWYKNSVKQSGTEYNTSLLGYNNLSVGDSWYCQVAPGDGLATGAMTQSSARTIASTIRNATMFLNGTNVWSRVGYFVGPQIILDFSQSLQTAVDNCIPDAQGFCDVDLTFYTNGIGNLSLSSLGIFYRQTKLSSDQTPPNVTTFGMNYTNGSTLPYTASIVFNVSVNDSTAVDKVTFGFTNLWNYSQFNVTAMRDASWYYTLLQLSTMSTGFYNVRVYANDTRGNMNNSVQNVSFFMYVPILVLNSTEVTTNNTNQNLTLYPQYLFDKNGNPGKNITNWFRNSTSITSLNMPFEGINGTSSNNAWDYSGHGYQGVEKSGITWSSGAGVDGWGAYEFDGTNDFIVIPGSSNLASLTAFSITAWIYPKNCLKTERIVVKGTANAQGQSQGQIMVDTFNGTYNNGIGQGCGIALEFINSTGVVESSGYPSGKVMNNHTWYFVAATFNNGAMRTYLNGEWITSWTAAQSSIPYSLFNWSIGELESSDGQWPQNMFFNGTIDEINIYNRSLSQQQIIALFNNRTGLIHSYETEINDVWEAEVTPNDGLQDGVTKKSNSVIIRP